MRNFFSQKHSDLSMVYRKKAWKGSFYKNLTMIIATLFAVVVALIALIDAINFLQKPFPGFGIYPNAYVAISPGLRIPLSETRKTQKLESLDKIISVNGQAVFSGKEIHAIVSQKPVGSLIHYGVQQFEHSPFLVHAKQKEVYQIQIASRILSPMELISSFATLFFAGFFYIVIGATAFFLKPGRKSRTLFTLCLFVGVLLLIIFDSFTSYRFSHNLYQIVFWLIPASVLEMALAFPRESKRFEGRVWLVWLPYLLGFLPLLGFQFFANDIHWFQLHLVVFFLVDSTVIYFFLRLAKQLRQVEGDLIRRRAKVLLVGSLAGFLPPTLLLFFGVAFGIDPPGGYLSGGLLLLIPLTFAYAIVRHDLLNIDVLVKRGLFYVALLSIAGVFYFLLLFALSFLAVRAPVANSPLFPLVFAALVVFLTEPLRRKLWRFTDRIYFRRGYDYRNILKAASEEMVRVRDPDEVLHKLQSTIKDALECESVEIFLERILEKPLEQSSLAQICYLQSSAVSIFFLQDEENILKEKERTRALKELKALCAKIALPLIVEGKLLGIFTLGAKKSGRLYTAEDLFLLQTLSNQSAVALENARRFRLIQELNTSLENKVFARTKALEETRAWLIQSEKMAALGRLVAGVAHEINNPANVIDHAGSALGEMADTLLTALEFLQNTFFSKETTDFWQKMQEKYRLARIKEDIPVMMDILQSASKRIASLVLDLRIFSRGKILQAREVHIQKEIERAIRILHPRISANVSIIQEFSGPDTLLCYPDALGQVFVNLLSNALDASDESGEIRITSKKQNDFLEICFQDSGPGIEPENFSKVFEPFFTTKDPGKGTGLGLWISYQIAEQHGGNLRVEAPKGNGACFCLSLPLSGPKKPDQHD